MSEPTRPSGPAPENARKVHAHPPRTSRGSDPDRALWALLFFIVLAVGCYFLVQKMRRDAWIQECVSRGRRNCDPDNVQVNDR